jgi:hypothetical protein
MVWITAMASTEVRWNGILVGRNGQPGPDRASERPGASSPISQSLPNWSGQETTACRCASRRTIYGCRSGDRSTSSRSRPTRLLPCLVSATICPPC